MSILHDARAILALLQPMTGARAEGTATVRSTGATGMIPANTHAAPVVDGAIRWDWLVKTKVNPDTYDRRSITEGSNGAWPVTSAGVSVPMVSVLGGPQYNLDERTTLRWSPVPEGIVETATVDAVPFVGGAKNATPVGLADVRIFEQIQNAPNTVQDLVRAAIAAFPAAVLYWDSSEPDDGQGMQPLGNLPSRMGRAKKLFRDVWELMLFVSRQDSDPARREQALAIIDEAREILTDKQIVDGMIFSTVRGLAIHSIGRLFTSPQVYAYRIRFSTANVLERREPRTWGPWAHTRLDVDSPDRIPFPRVRDVEFGMPQ